MVLERWHVTLEGPTEVQTMARDGDHVHSEERPSSLVLHSRIVTLLCLGTGNMNQKRGEDRAKHRRQQSLAWAQGLGGQRVAGTHWDVPGAPLLASQRMGG